MIKLAYSEYDDAAFLSLAQRIMNGVIAALHVREVFLVHVDSWFDHKWLGWRSRKGEEKLRIPLFTPNRVRSEKHLVWDVEKARWTAADLPRPLHIRQAGRPWLAQPLVRFSKCAAFIWYSGKTETNKIGSLMVYLSSAESYAWYASFKKQEDWTVDDECRITRRELVSFEERGLQIESAQTKGLAEHDALSLTQDVEPTAATGLPRE